MTDKLTDRLRGKYKVGPNGIYGTRDFSDFIPPISLEAAQKIEDLEDALDRIRIIVVQNKYSKCLEDIYDICKENIK